MLGAIVDHCRKRIAQGDCPTGAAFTVEQLEEAIVQLSDNIASFIPPDPEVEITGEK